MTKSKTNRRGPIKRATARDVAKELPVIRLLSQIQNPNTRRDILKAAGPKLTLCIESISRNLLAGNIRGATAQAIIKKHKKCLEKLASPKFAVTTKQHLLGSKQTGGFLQFLLPLLPTVASAIGSLISGATSKSE